MRELVHKLSDEFYSFPIFLQIFCVSVSWLLVVFTTDCWFCPYVLKGYQLATYIFIVATLTAYIAKKSLCLLCQSKVLWGVESGSEDIKLSMRDVSETELHTFGATTTETIISYWQDSEFSDSDEFNAEIRNQVNDTLLQLGEKLSHVQLHSFLKNFVLILHNHVKSYNKAVRVSHLSSSTNGPNHHFRFSHPVLKGDLSLKSYLDCLSHAIMREFIPGSIQDCQAVFDLICATFCSQFLLKFIDHISQPELLLESLIEALESPSSVQTEFRDCCEFEQDLAIEEDSSVCIEQVQDFASENEKNLANCLVTGVALDSCIETGLSSLIPTLTIPLLSQREDLHQTTEDELKSKPNSLDIADEPTASVMKDVSPVYEDVEDFATAIAKLRTLLEQRVSTNGTENSLPNGNSSFCPTSDSRLYSSGGETESGLEDVTEASAEISGGNRIFLNIKIPRTELSSQQGEGQHSIYCITYDGIYSIGTSPDDINKVGRLVLKGRTVKRRFDQFLQLHAQLQSSENITISQAIRTIRGPTKWLNLPFSRLDHNTVAHRQSFLERYMQQLINCVAIRTCSELRLFLDYEVNFNESTSQSPRVPFFTRTVSGVLQSIKTALPLPIPGFDHDQSSQLLTPIPAPPPIHCDLNVDHKDLSVSHTPSVEDVDVDSTYSVVFSAEMDPLEQLLSSYDHDVDLQRVESAYEALESQSNPSVNQDHESHSTASALNQPTLSIQTDGWNRFDDDIALTSSLINLVVECLNCQETWMTKAPVPLAVKILFGRRLEQLIQGKILQLVSGDKLTSDFGWLRQEWHQSSAREPPDAKKDINELRTKLVDLLKNQLPGGLSLMLGEELLVSVLKMLVSLLSDGQFNQDLALTFLDFLFSQISSLCHSTESR